MAGLLVHVCVYGELHVHVQPLPSVHGARACMVLETGITIQAEITRYNVRCRVFTQMPASADIWADIGSDVRT